MARRRRKRTIGGALIETVAGLFVLIPVVLFIVDVVAMVLAQMAHDAVAKDCARAAAEEQNAGAAQAAATATVSHFNSPFLQVQSPPLCQFNTGAGTVRVETRATFTFPVPIPFVGLGSQIFVAEAIEPIVGVAAP